EHSGLELVPGVEISAEFPQGTLHILGYYIDYRNSSLHKSLGVLQDARAERNPKIVLNLQALGINISYEEIVQEAGTGLVGRPHFAQVLLKKGYVKSVQEAFDRYLKKGSPAYEEKFRFPIKDAIRMIADAGGIPVLSHPFTLNCNRQQLEYQIKTWLGLGLQGIEVYYSEHDSMQTKQYTELARKYKLAITGGSDFHGQTVRGIDLGTGKGNLTIPYSVLEGLKQKKFQ
ncbi:MAG: phosphoesterase, partial [Proteobacteria bacterium]|nr:phosphoesterase [Pseudomonadota bacterium]